MKMIIEQKVILDTHTLMSIKYGEDYRIETRLIATWKKYGKICKYKCLDIIIDYVKCEDIEITKIDQMKEISKRKVSIEECLKINPDIILTK